MTEAPVAAASRTGWPLAASMVAAAMTWLAAWYWDTASAMVATWESSQTYAHGFLVIPISAWLIWRERFRLAALRPRHDLKVLPLFAIPGVAWLLADLSGVRVGQQFAMIFMIVLSVWALLGYQVVKTLAFPLMFLLFAVPVGDFLLPYLMEHTAGFTVFALKLTGVPVYREGMSITVPTGDWSVVEACSGLRYLIACFTGGVLYAFLRYRSASRRLAFIAAAAVVPVVANWVRAYLIVMIGELSGGKVAAGVDHLIYGWIFFGIVTLLLFGIASMWREDADAAHAVAPPPVRPGGRVATRSGLVLAGIAAAIAIAVWPAAAWQLDAAQAPPPHGLATPDAGEWQMHDTAFSDWKPHFIAPTAVAQTYAKGGDRAALYIAYYRDQRRAGELISSVNTLASREQGWRVVSESVRPVAVGGEGLAPLESHIQKRSTRLLVWQWYWVDGARTTSAYYAKLLQLRSQLRGHGDDAAVVVVYTELDEEPSRAAAVLRDFAATALPGITRALEDARLR
jgi:exosortase A